MGDLTLGQRMKGVRKEKGFTIKQVAEGADIMQNLNKLILDFLNREK